MKLKIDMDCIFKILNIINRYVIAKLIVSNQNIAHPNLEMGVMHPFVFLFLFFYLLLPFDYKFAFSLLTMS